MKGRALLGDTSGVEQYRALYQFEACHTIDVLALHEHIPKSRKYCAFQQLVFRREGVAERSNHTASTIKTRVTKQSIYPESHISP